MILNRYEKTKTKFLFELRFVFLLLLKAFGISKEEFDSYISNGIILWGQSVTDVLEEGQLRIRQTIRSEMTPLVSILIEGINKKNL